MNRDQYSQAHAVFRSLARLSDAAIDLIVERTAVRDGPVVAEAIKKTIAMYRSAASDPKQGHVKERALLEWLSRQSINN